MNKVIQRNRIQDFEHEFESLHKSAVELLEAFPEDHFFAMTGLNGELISFGVELIRSAAEVEKAFGGITRRLWDDPFEWTLPEELSDKAAIKNYLDEVRSTRTKGLRFIKHDGELSQQIPAPEKFLSLSEILTETISLASVHLERATAISAAIEPA
jgi:hypothetical protein